MKTGRLWRTIQPVGPARLCHRVRLRARRALMARFAVAARRRTEARASRLALPDIAAPALAESAGIVLTLQQAVHGGDPDRVAAARFMLHNQLFEFGAIENIDWRGDFREGNNPLRRMTLAYMGYLTPLLARGRESDLAVAGRIVASFETGNSWRAAGVLGDAWHPYAASHRLINLLAGLALYRKAGGPENPGVEGQILRHARLCAVHVQANLERDVQYNHLMKNLVALAVYRAGLPAAPQPFAGLDADIRRSVAQCVLGDGGHAERSPMYHLLGLLDLRILLVCGRASETAELPELTELTGIETRMTAALRVMTHPDGEIALFNDAWFGEAPRASDVAGPGEVDETAVLDDTGYARLGRGDDAVIFDFGRCGPDDNPAHAHADFLAVELSVAGRRLIVDPGVATYTAGELRHATRSAASHNGPHVVGADSLELWGAFRVGRRAQAGALANPALAGFAPLWRAGWHDGYRSRGIMARRWVGLWPGQALLLCDLWLHDGGRAPCAANFLVPGGWRIAADEPVAFVQDEVSVRLKALAGALSDPVPDRYWPRFDAPEPAHRITLTPGAAAAGPRAALWLSWGDDATVPDGDTLARLFDGLAAVDPTPPGGLVMGGS
jgi:heparinase II/III-like protein